MKDVVFAIELKGKAAPIEGTKNTLKAKLTGRGARGETVTLESQVLVNGDTFDESGSIDYSGHGKLIFETVGVGHLRPSPVPRLQSGAVIWQITKGEGEFMGATGYVTSNFTISDDGDVIDNQYVRIFTP